MKSLFELVANVLLLPLTLPKSQEIKCSHQHLLAPLFMLIAINGSHLPCHPLPLTCQSKVQAAAVATSMSWTTTSLNSTTLCPLQALPSPRAPKESEPSRCQRHAVHPTGRPLFPLKESTPRPFLSPGTPPHDQETQRHQPLPPR